MPPRSERKYTLSPTHMGEVSLLSTHGSFSTEWSLRSITRIGCAAAAVVPPLAALLLRPLGGQRDRDVLVSDATAIGRIRAGERPRHRQPIREAGRGARGFALSSAIVHSRVR